MNRVEAVVFDADGTLFNSFELIYEAYQHIAETHGYAAPDIAAVREQLRFARPLHEILREFFPTANISELLETNNTFFVSNALKIEGYEGLHDLLARLSAQDIALAILTGDTSKINDLLAIHGVDHYFTSVVHSERVINHKPHPEGFLLAAKECGVRPTSAVMVGDSPNDIEAGKQAGALATIGITHGNASREDLQAAQADFIIDSLVDLPQVLQKI